MNNTLAKQSDDVETSAGKVLKSLVRAVPYLVVFVGLIAAATYFGLGQFAPEYTSQGTILIETGESETAEASEEASAAFDPESVASQVQLLHSRDLARSVAEKLDLASRREFNPALGSNFLLSDLLAVVGLGTDPLKSSVEERVLERFARRLSVHAIGESRLIAIEFSSEEPELAADAANAVADEYISVQRAASREMTADATKWLEGEISDLRAQVQEAEAKVEAYRANNDLLTSGQIPAASRSDDADHDLSAIEREAAARRDLLDTYLRRYRDALARPQGDYLPANARVISRASVPAESNFPKKEMMTVAAAVATSLLGIAFILIRELASGRRTRQVAVVPLPVVPEAMAVTETTRWADDQAVRRILPADTALAAKRVDRTDESLSAIAGRIIADGYKRVIVTMAEGADLNGRPLAAVALARAIARADRRPVLIDLRADGANSVSMGEGTDLPGFSDLFTGGASFAQVIFRDRKSRVHFIPGGSRPLVPTELADERSGALIDALDLTYDHVILDAGDDVVDEVAPGCGAAIVVSEFGASNQRTIRAVERVKAVSDAEIIILVVAAAVGRQADTVPAPVAGEAA